MAQDNFMGNSLNFLDQSILGNSINNYLIALVIILAGFMLKTILSAGATKLVYRIFKNKMKDVLPSELLSFLKAPLNLLFVLLVLYFVSELISVPRHWEWAEVPKFGLKYITHKAYLTTVLGAFTWLGVRIIKVLGLIFQRRAKKTESRIDDQLAPFFRDLTILLFVIMMGFVVLGKVFEIDVLTLVTSLGIGGLAIALAAKETLENLFASFALMLDRPFTVGDSINVGGIEGVVEKIGFRSTRLRTVDGSLVTMPNRLLTSQSLDNLSERNLKRARYLLKLDTETSPEQLIRLTNEVKKKIIEHEYVEKSSVAVNFDSFSDNSLDVVVVYFVDIKRFVEIKEKVNLQIIAIAENIGVKFAFASRDMYFRNENDLKNTPEKRIVQ